VITECKTLARTPYVPADEVIRQVRARLAVGNRPDFITFSGSGEPTLHAQLGEMIAAVKHMTDIPVAILTNGSLFWDPAVRRDCAQADLVLPSLDAGDEAMFRYVNRPHADLDFQQGIEGLVAFRREFRGPIWLEVFVLAGVTGLRAEVEKMRRHVEAIAPDRVQINTVVRPPAEDFAFRVDDQRLAELARLLGPTAEVISEPAAPQPIDEGTARDVDILALLTRRPSSIEDIARGLVAGQAEVAKCISTLLAKGMIRAVRSGKDLLFALDQPKVAWTNGRIGAKG